MGRTRIVDTSLLCITAALFAACTPPPEPVPEPTRPNIVFFVADDMGYAVPASYGGRHIQTPTIDRLAQEGMRFTRAYSGNPVCAPSRAALLLGKHNGRTSLRGNTGGISILEEDVTMTDVLQRAGYKVGVFGKWGLGDANTPGVPWNKGVDEFYGYLHQIHAHFYYTEYLWENGEKVVLNDGETSDVYSQDLVLEKMLRFIRDNENEPFFCFAPWILPHADDDGVFVIPESDPAYQLYADEPWSDDVKGYAAMNTRLDSDMGTILDLLEELGIDERTIVVFASDNGAPEETLSEFFNPSGELRGFKRSMYEGGVRVPLVVKWPGTVEPGSVSDLMTYFPDLMPTFAEMVQALEHLPSDLDGISIVPTLSGQEQERTHEAIYWELPNYDWSENYYPEAWLMQGMRMGDWKLLRHETTSPWELYDLSQDPSETTNVAGANPDVVERMLDWIARNRTEPIPQIEPEMPEGKWYR